MTETASNPSICPLCGGENACAVATAMESCEECWCMSVTIPEEVLGRIPEEARSRVCVCAACARGGSDRAGSGEERGGDIHANDHR